MKFKLVIPCIECKSRYIVGSLSEKIDSWAFDVNTVNGVYNYNEERVKVDFFTDEEFVPQHVLDNGYEPKTLYITIEGDNVTDDELDELQFVIDDFKFKINFLYYSEEVF